MYAGATCLLIEICRINIASDFVSNALKQRERKAEKDR